MIVFVLFIMLASEAASIFLLISLRPSSEGNGWYIAPDDDDRMYPAMKSLRLSRCVLRNLQARSSVWRSAKLVHLNDWKEDGRRQ